MTTPGGAGRLGRAADGAEVARVLDLVEGDDQRALPAQQRVAVGVGIRIHLGDDALVVRRPAEPLQLLGRGLRRPPDPVHPPPPPLRLLDRPLAVDRSGPSAISGPSGTSRAPSAASRTSQPSSASRSRISSARPKSFAARASSRSASSASASSSAQLPLSLGKRARARRAPASPRTASGAPGTSSRFASADQLEHLGHRPRRVEVVGQRLPEALASGAGRPRSLPAVAPASLPGSPTGCSRKKFRSRSTRATACSICSAPKASGCR